MVILNRNHFHMQNCALVSMPWGGGWVFCYFVFQENFSFPMFNLLTSDVNTVTLVLRMILACVKCGQKPLEIEGYCILSHEVKIQKQKTIKP